MQPHRIEVFQSFAMLCIHIAFNDLIPALRYSDYITLSHLIITLSYAAYKAEQPEWL